MATGVYALVSAEVRYGNATIGVVVDSDGLTLIDTFASPRLAAGAQRELDLLAPDFRVKRVVLTTSRVASIGGTATFWQAAMYASAPVSDELDEPLAPSVAGRLIPQHESDYRAEFATRPASHLVDETAHLTPAVVVSAVPGEHHLNVIADVPASEPAVLFLGAVGSFGVTPLAFDTDPIVWAATLRRLAELDRVFVPGHGLPGGAAQCVTQAEYLEACVRAAGDVERLPSGPWDDWSDRRFDAVNVERAARLAVGDHSPPTAMLEMLGLG